MKSAIDIARYIINMIKTDNLKLQKLLYYCQAVSLVKNDKALFDDVIEAWQYGPVVPNVYHEYKEYGFDCIEKQPEPQLSIEEMEVIDLVVGYYGEMSAVYLVNKTHSEDPWKNVYEPGIPNIVISNESIKEYYKNVISIQ